MLALLLLPFLLVTACFAAPSRRQQNCVPNDAVYIPRFQNEISAPDMTLQFVTLGVGNQNYTCSSSGTYLSTGAVVQIFDTTNLFPSFEFYQIQDLAYLEWVAYSNDDPYDPNLAQQFTDTYGIQSLGQHYFIDSADQNAPKGTITPVWDFRETKGPNALVLANVTGDLPSPSAGPPSVDWVELTALSGDLANYILRLYTVGGVQPTECSPGSGDISVKFTTQYWLYGGNVGSC